MPCSLICLMVSKMRSTSTGARPIDGSSSIRSFGRPISARATASICCSPPDSVPAFCVEALLEAREELEHLLAVLRDPLLVVAQERAEVEVLVDRHAAEDAPPLGRLARCRARHLVARHAADLACPRTRSSRGGADEAGDGAHRGRLAGPVRADQGHDLALLDLERDALDRGDVAVVDVDVVDLSIGSLSRPGRVGRVAFVLIRDAPSSPVLPRYASITRSSVRISSRPALGDLRAVVEHGDVLGDAHHDLHVVLDQEHGQPFSSRTRRTNVDEVGRLLRVHAGRRLVEEEQLRPQGERARHLEAPLVAVREVLRELVLVAAARRQYSSSS